MMHFINALEFVASIIAPQFSFLKSSCYNFIIRRTSITLYMFPALSVQSGPRFCCRNTCFRDACRRAEQPLFQLQNNFALSFDGIVFVIVIISIIINIITISIASATAQLQGVSSYILITYDQLLAFSFLIKQAIS